MANNIPQCQVICRHDKMVEIWQWIKFLDYRQSLSQLHWDLQCCVIMKMHLFHAFFKPCQLQLFGDLDFPLLHSAGKSYTNVCQNAHLAEYAHTGRVTWTGERKLEYVSTYIGSNASMVELLLTIFDQLYVCKMINVYMWIKAIHESCSSSVHLFFRRLGLNCLINMITFMIFLKHVGGMEK